MSKLTTYIPSYCSYKASIEKPDNWDDLSEGEKKSYFLDNMESEGFLCHQCSKDIESDLEPAQIVDDKDFKLHYDEDDE